MKKILWVSMLLIACSLFGALAGFRGEASAAASTTLTQQNELTCKIGNEAKIVMTDEVVCLPTGNNAVFSSITEIENSTDVTLTFFNRTLSETFRLAPGEHLTFEGDEGRVYLPSK